MTIVRDDQRVARLRSIGFWASLVGMVVLISGLVIGLVAESAQALLWQLIAIPVGWVVSQVGIYLTHRYTRSPRPDEVLDEALRPVARQGRLYHYVLPAPHVLLTPAGVIVFVAKFQGGHITYENGRWRQSGIGLVRRIFGQEGLGNPGAEAERYMGKMANFIREKAPQVEEVPMGAMIVFTSKQGSTIDAKEAPIPTVHYAKLKGLFKQKAAGPPMPATDYTALREAFDAAAGSVAT